LKHPGGQRFRFSTWNAFGVHGWPTFILINPMGIVESTYSGEGNRQKLADAIERVRGKI